MQLDAAATLRTLSTISPIFNETNLKMQPVLVLVGAPENYEFCSESGLRAEPRPELGHVHGATGSTKRSAPERFQ